MGQTPCRDMDRRGAVGVSALRGRFVWCDGAAAAGCSGGLLGSKSGAAREHRVGVVSTAPQRTGVAGVRGRQSLATRACLGPAGTARAPPSARGAWQHAAASARAPSPPDATTERRRVPRGRRRRRCHRLRLHLLQRCRCRRRSLTGQRGSATGQSPPAPPHSNALSSFERAWQHARL